MITTRGLGPFSPVALLAAVHPPWRSRSAVQQPGEPHDLQARRVMTPPKLDGVLDDEAWSAGPQTLDPWMSYNPLRGQKELLADAGLDRLRRQGDLLRVQVPRPRARQDPNDDQPARQRVERRLGGREPRLEPRRSDGVPHVHQPERHPDGCAADPQRGHRRRLDLAERRPRGLAGLHGGGAAAAPEHPLQGR